MDGETKATLLEQHAFILEEVAAEFDYFVELDSPEQAEQVCVIAESLLGLRFSCLSFRPSLNEDSPLRVWLFRGRHILRVEITVSQVVWDCDIFP